MTSTDEDVITANLPLLFAYGNPIALQLMTAEDCQYFLAFLMRCVLGCDVAPNRWTRFRKPDWWLPKVPWSSFILTRKYQTEKWAKNFQDLIMACYSFNANLPLLIFSERLCQGRAKGWLYRYHDNQDGTITMYHVQTGRMLVTFRSENLNYDREVRHNIPLRPALLPRSPAKNSHRHDHNGVDPPLMTELSCDIYLCESCGTGFVTEAAVKAHEVHCLPQEEAQPQPVSKNNNVSQMLAVKENCIPEPVEPKVKENLPENDRAMNKAQVLFGLGLLPAEATLPLEERSTTATSHNRNLLKELYAVVPFSSRRGRKTYKRFELSKQVAKAQVKGYESSSPAKASLRSSHIAPESEANQVRWRVTFHKGRTKKQGLWSHQYRFRRKDGLKRLLVTQTGLSREARLLLKHCQRKAVVHLRRLSDAEIGYWLQPKSKPRPQSIPPNPLRTNVADQPHLSQTVQILPYSFDETSCEEDLYVLPDVELLAEDTLRPGSSAIPKQPSSSSWKQPLVIDLCSSDEEEASSSTTGRSISPQYQQLKTETTRAATRPRSQGSIPRNVKGLMIDECKELRVKGLEALLYSAERTTRRRSNLLGLSCGT